MLDVVAVNAAANAASASSGATAPATPDALSAHSSWTVLEDDTIIQQRNSDKTNKEQNDRIHATSSAEQLLLLPSDNENEEESLQRDAQLIVSELLQKLEQTTTHHGQNGNEQETVVEETDSTSAKFAAKDKRQKLFSNVACQDANEFNRFRNILVLKVLIILGFGTLVVLSTFGRYYNAGGMGDREAGIARPEITNRNALPSSWYDRDRKDEKLFTTQYPFSPVFGPFPLSESSLPSSPLPPTPSTSSPLPADEHDAAMHSADTGTEMKSENVCPLADAQMVHSANGDQKNEVRVRVPHVVRITRLMRRLPIVRSLLTTRNVHSLLCLMLVYVTVLVVVSDVRRYLRNTVANTGLTTRSAQRLNKLNVSLSASTANEFCCAHLLSQHDDQYYNRNDFVMRLRHIADKITEELECGEKLKLLRQQDQHQESQQQQQQQQQQPEQCVEKSESVPSDCIGGNLERCASHLELNESKTVQASDVTDDAGGEKEDGIRDQGSTESLILNSDALSGLEHAAEDLYLEDVFSRHRSKLKLLQKSMAKEMVMLHGPAGGYRVAGPNNKHAMRGLKRRIMRKLRAARDVYMLELTARVAYSWCPRRRQRSSRHQMLA